MDEPQDKENALAGLLTGTMFSALGGMFPALLVWSVATRWQAVISGNHTMTPTEAMQGVGLLTVSVPIFYYGLKMVITNARAFKRL